ncbi:MAG: class I SAM-dependent methyltransferase [Candidatus Omnitrophica bacterium]|nr:class I SAM-dependent methyltransferase [Candidatus Omnitrophota bacterium]
MGNPVADYYNQSPELEWTRLTASPYRRIEYEVVRFFLDKHLPSQGAILDLGGGPGRYALALAKQGWQATLLDLSEANIRFAETKRKAFGIDQRRMSCQVGDALDLSRFRGEQFDAALCMGPLYHLPSLPDRLQCLRECRRVLKPQAPLFVTVLPRLTYLRDALRCGSFAGMIPRQAAVFDEIFEQGISQASMVPQTYYCRPDEVKLWFEQTGFELIELASCHGFASFMDDRVNEIGKNAEAWNSLIRWVISTCSDPQALSMAEHLVGVGWKRGNSGERAC